MIARRGQIGKDANWMQWSQLKTQLKARIATSVAGTIDFHQTRYRHSHDQEGEFWITLGKERIFSAGSLSYLSALSHVTSGHRANGATLAEAYQRAWPELDAYGLMLLEAINKDLFSSLSMTVKEMLDHSNPIVRALAVVDTRYGKRRLAAFNPVDEPPLVHRFFYLRCEAEGIKPSAPPPSPRSPPAPDPRSGRLPAPPSSPDNACR
jgi:hypothetical protein